MKQTEKQLNKQLKTRLFRCEIVIFTVLLILICSFISIVKPPKKFSENENRTLAGRPELTIQNLISGNYFKDFSNYCADQIAGRDMWMKMSSAGKRIEGKKDIGGCYIGKKGYLLEKPETPDEEACNNTVKAINRFAEKNKKLNIYTLFVPGAPSILEDKLPPKAPVGNQIKDLLKMEKELKYVTVLDPVEALRKNSKNYIYYKTDHHWTSLGAYEVFKATADQMDIKKKTYKETKVTDNFYGTLASKTGIFNKADSVSVYKPENCNVDYIVNYMNEEDLRSSCFKPEELKKKDKYLVFFGGNYPMIDIKTTSDSEKNLLILKDSYANSYIQFLYPYYKRIIVIDPRYYYDNVETVVKTYGITDVLFLYSGNTIVKDTNLADALG